MKLFTTEEAAALLTEHGLKVRPSTLKTSRWSGTLLGRIAPQHTRYSNRAAYAEPVLRQWLSEALSAIQRDGYVGAGRQPGRRDLPAADRAAQAEQARRAGMAGGAATKAKRQAVAAA